MDEIKIYRHVLLVEYENCIFRTRLTIMIVSIAR